MNRPGISILLAICLLFSAAAPTRAQAVFGGATATGSREAAKAAASNAQLLGRYPASRFLKLELVDGVLAAELLADLPPQMQPVRVEVEGSAATWLYRKRPTGAVGSKSGSITRYDFDAPPDQAWSTALLLRPGYLAVYTQYGDNVNGLRVRLTQANGALSFSCTRLTNGAQNTFLLASAPSLRQLQVDHPREVRAFLMPLLQRLSGRALLKPGAADVYRVFDTIHPDPQVAKKLDELLLRLDSDDYARRDGAARELSALGAPTVLAALRHDTTDLSPEARNRLGQFIASRSNVSIDGPAAARNDADFLIDCLEDDDPRVRAAAKSALEELGGKPLSFDVETAGDEPAVLDALRAQFHSRTPIPRSSATSRPGATRAVR
ncbi:MAG TPA: hypothetical protein VH475_16455 [Tepidisphaeraceae bacterium]|jgi:hypothetical protein